MLMYFHFSIFQLYMICGDSFGDWHGNNHLRRRLGMGMTCGDGDNVENSSGDGMGMTGEGTVGDGDKYLSPCSSLVPVWASVDSCSCSTCKAGVYLGRRQI